MSTYVYKTPNAGELIDLQTGIKYTFLRESITGVETPWNIKEKDIVSFTVSGTTAISVTLFRKHIPGTLYSYNGS